MGRADARPAAVPQLQSGALGGEVAYYRRFHGRFTPQNVVFDANLQEFAIRVGYICARENGGMLSPTAAFTQVQILWEQLALS
jgi:hypothetical protein